MNFNLGSLRDWQHVSVGEMIAFDVPKGSARGVDFDVISDAYIRICAHIGDEVFLVAVGEGQFNVRFNTQESVVLGLHGEASAVVQLRTKCATQVFAACGEPTFTTAEPARAKHSADVQRMWEMMQMNQLQMSRGLAELRRENHALKHSLAPKKSAPKADGEVIEKEDGSKPKSAPKAAPKAPAAKSEGVGDAD